MNSIATPASSAAVVASAANSVHRSSSASLPKSCTVTTLGCRSAAAARGAAAAADLRQLLAEGLLLAALGTVADVARLKTLNRAFVTQGLKVMATRRNVGLTALAATDYSVLITDLRMPGASVFDIEPT